MNPYEYDREKNVVQVCAFHETKALLEARAQQEHPSALLSHGICSACKARMLGTIKPTVQIEWTEGVTETINIKHR